MLNKDKLPLIFHLLKQTAVDDVELKSQQQYITVNVPFYQTPHFQPHIFYKPISKIVTFKSESDERKNI